MKNSLKIIGSIMIFLMMANLGRATDKTLAYSKDTIEIGIHKPETYYFSYTMAKNRLIQSQRITIVDNGTTLSLTAGAITGDTIKNIGYSSFINGGKDYLTIDQEAYTGSVVYIDPTASTNGTGTKTSPWNGSAISNDPWVANTTYLFKRGTTFSHTKEINIQVLGVTFGAYGTGTMPVIRQTANTKNIVGRGGLTVRDLEIVSPVDSGDCYNFAFMPLESDLTVMNCKIHGEAQGIRVLNRSDIPPYNSGQFSFHVKVIGCEISTMWSDGIFVVTNTDSSVATSVEVGNSTVYDVNRSEPNDPADGDCIHVTNIKSVWVHHNTLDHTSTPGKFCLILANDGIYQGNGLIEYNVMTRTRGGVDNTIYYNGYAKGSSTIIRYNKFSGALLGMQSRTYDTQIYYNTFGNMDHVLDLNAGSAASNCSFYNNTIYNVGKVLYGWGETVDFKNNIVSKITGTDPALDGGGNLNSDYNCYYTVANMGPHGTHDKLTTNPLFVDTLTFYLQSTSPALNTGYNLGLKKDLGGNSVDNSPNMGCRELNADNNFPLSVGITDATIANISYTISSLSHPDGVATKDNISTEYGLSQNYPNPFNPRTAISYSLLANSQVRLTVYDMLGREIATLVNENKPAGKYSVEWDASNYSSGVYFYCLMATPLNGGSNKIFSQTNKLMLLK